MTNEFLFYTQITSILAFVSALFVLYRIIVKQKEATIQLLKEKIEFVSFQLKESKNQQPDILVEALSNRAKALTDELENLYKDKEANEQQIKSKEEELETTTQGYNKLRAQFERAEDLMKEFFCPYCKAPMESREFFYDYEVHNGKEIDVDHVDVTFACGLELADGEEVAQCSNISKD